MQGSPQENKTGSTSASLALRFLISRFPIAFLEHKTGDLLRFNGKGDAHLRSVSNHKGMFRRRRQFIIATLKNSKKFVLSHLERDIRLIVFECSLIGLENGRLDLVIGNS